MSFVRVSHDEGGIISQHGKHPAHIGETRNESETVIYSRGSEGGRVKKRGREVRMNRSS